MMKRKGFGIPPEVDNILNKYVNEKELASFRGSVKDQGTLSSEKELEKSLPGSTDRLRNILKTQKYNKFKGIK